MDDNNSFNGLEKEGLQYVVGYVASRFAKKYTLMVSEEQTTNDENWIRYLSKGGLTYPSSQLIKVANIMEKLFIDLHGNHLIISHFKWAMKLYVCRHTTANTILLS